MTRQAIKLKNLKTHTVVSSQNSLEMKGEDDNLFSKFMH